ncbi:probable F-box protein At4g22030 [Coffea arabica]|uniref:Probable F-box protein At4g22030 n=1 Tax=Coffea arabica TaxID=13443 RepID=A0A6P6UH65_COFAR|nr:probable F-box protein At4g22030 [Coffea arabica]
MATLQSSALLQYSSPKICRERTISAILGIPKSRTSNIPLHNLQQAGPLVKEMELARGFIGHKKFTKKNDENELADSLVMKKLYAVLEAVADRVEMHKNIGEQRDNWNSLLLTSINAITLAASTMSGIAATTAVSAGTPLAALKLSSTMMFLAATGMLFIMNKIQPSQLAEEQRNAARLFQQLQKQIETTIAIGKPTDDYVEEAMERVLALDKAYPLPLLGVMLDKFPSKVDPAVWWPQQAKESAHKTGSKANGWNSKLEKEMRSIVEVIRRRDKADYLSLGGKALKLNKLLAIGGPLLTGLAVVGSAFVGSSSQIGFLAAMLGVVGGSLASIVNTLEHGVQVGMVFEMYRSNAGFFKLMEESIESNLMERREHGELFEMKVALQLGRSVSELRDLAASPENKEEGAKEEFASKLF